MCKVSKFFIKAAAGFCVLFASLGAVSLMIGLYRAFGSEKILSAVSYPILPVCIAAFFLIVNSLSDKLKHKPIIFCAVSAALIAYGIIISPYNPCYDSLDLHAIINRMMKNEPVDVWLNTYMDFWINNKLTALIYLPAAKLFGDVTAGVRSVNGILLCATAVMISSSAAQISEKHRYGALLIASACSPFMLLSGPYIYLPAIFLSSAAIRGLLGKSKKSKAALILCSACLFVLRPTAFGVIPVMLTADILFNIDKKKRALTSAVCLALCAVCAFGFKAAVGGAMYKSENHKYPSMNSAAMLWTLDLGTRPNGIHTGTCSYSPWNRDDNYDEIQNKFNDLWMIYYNDEYNGTYSYDRVLQTQSELKELLVERLKSMSFSDYMKNIAVKTGVFFYNNHIPYYFRTNVAYEKSDLSVDYNKKYFEYMNNILMLFFIAALINLIAVFARRDSSDGTLTAAALAAAAVNIVLILMTEVSKKYMFDFYVPMMLCISFIFSGTLKKIPRAVSAAAALLCVIRIASAEMSYRIDILNNVKTELYRDGSVITMNIELDDICLDNYSIETKRDGIISLYAQKSISVAIDDDDFEAIRMYDPDGNIIYFSSQIIE